MGDEIVVATNSKMSKVLWISGAVIVVAILILVSTIFLWTPSDKSPASSLVNTTVDEFWCSSGDNFVKEDFPKEGQSLEVKSFGVFILQDEEFCRVLETSTGNQYYYNIDSSKIYVVQAGESRSNMALVS